MKTVSLMIQNLQKKCSLALFYMLGLTFFLNVNFTILRSLRNALAVVDLGKGAFTIPLYELLGAFPAAFLASWGLSKLLSRYNYLKVFLLSLGMFVFFFILFTFVLYPHLQAWKVKEGAFYSLMVQFLTMTFYAVSELWKPILIMTLFWGLINQSTSFKEGKKLYAYLAIGASFGSVIAGPLISFCTRWINFTNQSWKDSLNCLTALLIIVSIIVAYFFIKLWGCLKHSISHSMKVFQEGDDFKSSLVTSWKSLPLRWMGVIVIADYIAYSLGEVIFLEILKYSFPDPNDYCRYIGILSSWSGIATLSCSLLIAPSILKNYRWQVIALITPLCLLITEGAFFFLLRCQILKGITAESQFFLSAAVVVGSIQYCLCRAAKYTFLDTSKELAFISIPSNERMKGKLVIDGISARFGKGFSSLMSMFLIMSFGGVLASSFVTGFMVLAMAMGWIYSTLRLDKEIQPKELKHA